MVDSRQIKVLNTDSSTQKQQEKNGTSTTNDTGAHEGIEISEHLQKSMLRMTGKFLDESKGTVDYKTLRTSQEFKEYCSLAVRLEKVDLPAFSEKERLVFFINIYNALTVHSICEIQSEKDIGTTLDVPDFWGTHAYNIGGFVLTLDDIEHGILRGNRVHPSTGTQVIKATDERATYSIKKVDPRIHFALNCGAKSCPMVRVYNYKNLEDALEAATKSYLSQEIYVDDKDDTLRIPQILEWYLADFAESEIGMLRWIEPYVNPSAKKVIQRLLEDNKDENDKKSNKGNASPVHYYYDWSLNKA